MRCRIERVDAARDLETLRTMFREYADGLGFDLAYQGIAAEFAELPGRYAAPQARDRIFRK